MAMESPAGRLPQRSAHTEIVTVGSTSGAVGIVFAVIGAIAFVIALGVLLAGSIPFGIFFALGAAITFGIGMFFYARSKAESQKWEPLELHFPTWELPLGSRSKVTVVRACKKPLPDAADVRLLAHVRCTEVVKYRVGSNEQTAREEVLRDQLDLVGSIENNTFTGVLALGIPTDRGGPTMVLTHNRISWEIGIQLGALSTIDTETTVDIRVAPELADSQRRFVDSPPPPKELPPTNA